MNGAEPQPRRDVTLLPRDDRYRSAGCATALLSTLLSSGRWGASARQRSPGLTAWAGPWTKQSPDQYGVTK